MRLAKEIKEKIVLTFFMVLIISSVGFLIYSWFAPFVHQDIDTLSLRIYINDDSDFDNYDFSGSGTFSDPYLIENYTYQEHGLYQISISGVSKHFIIRNNVIASKRFENGIYVARCSQNPSIINNIVLGSVYTHDFYEGIYIYKVGNCNIVNNTIYSKKYGIRVSDCSDCDIKQNNLKNGRNIEIQDSSNIHIMNNSLVLSEMHNTWSYINSIHIENSESVSIVQNQLFKSWIGFADNSILTAELQDNLINGKSVGFFRNLTNFLINSNNDYGQILIANCSNGIFTSVNMSFFNIGIDIFSSYKINVSSCSFHSNIYAGLFLYDTQNIIISNSSFMNNRYGTRVKYSDSIYFLNNIFQENYYAIYINDSNCSYDNNTFNNNNYDILTFND